MSAIESSATLSGEGQSMLEITMTSFDSIMNEVDGISAFVTENSIASTEADASIREQVSGMEELTASAKQLTDMAHAFQESTVRFYKPNSSEA